MATWMKKKFDATGVTEYPVGPHINMLKQKYATSGSAILAIDVSGSMYDDLPQAVKGAKQFLEEAVTGGYHVSVILWNDKVVRYCALSQDPTHARETLDKAVASGMTDALPAITLAEKYLDESRTSDKVLFVFGDGDLGFQKNAVIDVARRMREKGYRIITIGLGLGSAEALNTISTEDLEDGPRTTSSETLAEDIVSLKTGLRLK